MKKPIILVLAAFCLSLVVGLARVQAETPSTSATGETRMPLLQQKVDNSELRQEKIATRTADRCQLAEQRIDNALTRYQTSRTTQLGIFKSMSDRIQNIITKLQQRGADVSTLQADLSQFNTKIAQLNTDMAAAVNQLQVAKQFECGNSQGQFVSELQKARVLMQTVEKDARDVITYFQTKVRPDIKALNDKTKGSASASPKSVPAVSPEVSN